MYGYEISNKDKLVLHILQIVIIIVLLTIAYVSWRSNHLTSVITDELDGRTIEAITITTNSNEIALENDEIEYFVNNVNGYDTTIPSSLITEPSYLEWEKVIYRRPFQSISGPPYLMEIEYSDGTNSTILYTQSEIEIDNKLFKAPDNALYHFLLNLY
ncbi:hypothetical protein GCM10008932_01320 [Alkalibacterium iburiense]|uniref:Uncharacterized protein n=1 Tax=Alkalibacterium iburiense TaxID=290589 RepID=A0ABN0X0K2_9LACT